MKGQRLLRLYQKALHQWPYSMQAVQTAILMGTGDVISQILMENKAILQLDYTRTIQFSSIGLFISGPAARIWYGLLNKYVGSTGVTVAVKKVALDQLLFAPTFLFIFFLALGTLKRKPLNEIRTEIKAKFFDVLIANYYVWPWIQLLNFYFVPLQYQVLIVQSVALFWNTYLAWKINRKRSFQ